MLAMTPSPRQAGILMAGVHAASDSMSNRETLPLTNRMRGVLAVLLVPLVLATAVGTMLLWPDHRKHATPESLGQQAALVNAMAIGVRAQPCTSDPSGGVRCLQTTLRVTSGPDKGKTIALEIPQGPGQANVKDNDKLVLGRTVGPTGHADYYFSDFQRKLPLAGIAAVFALLVVLVGRWRGFGALVGLFITWLVITQYMLPAILEGKPPVLVALSGSAVIVLLALYVAHGFNARTTTALIGTLLSLGLTGLLAAFAVTATHLTGLANEESTYVQSFAGAVDLRGLILGGVIIGALGVLNDMTVTQSSAVREIHLAQPRLNRRALYSSGMRVGRDHIASTVYTLVLAYTGAALPLLILFTVANRSFTDVVGGELVAEEIVRTLIGSIGLILSVPITTALAAIVEKSRFTPARRTTNVEHEPALEPILAGTRFDDAEPVKPIPAMKSAATKSKTRGFLKRKQPEFSRKMGRRERKFWEGDS